MVLPLFLFTALGFNSVVFAQQETRNDKKASEKEIAKLLQDLITDDKTVQRKTLENLKKIDKNKIIEYCKKVLHGDNHDWRDLSRNSVLDYIGLDRDEKMIPLLIEDLKLEKNGARMSDLICTLCIFKNEVVIDKLINILKDPSNFRNIDAGWESSIESARGRIIRYLGENRVKKESEYLLKILETDKKLMTEAAIALANIQEKKAVPIIKELLKQNKDVELHRALMILNDEYEMDRIEILGLFTASLDASAKGNDDNFFTGNGCATLKYFNRT